jgi:hypothetical protein
MNRHTETIAAHRHLVIEQLESRMPLSADFVGFGVSGMLAELHKSTASGDFDLQSLSELISQTRERQASSNQRDLPIGDDPMVRFRVDWTDSAGNPASQVTDREVLVANVYVQDLSPDPSHGQPGGVFQAVVDLQFGSNLQPTGDVAVSDDFGSLRYDSGFDATTIRGVGGTSRQWVRVGGREQLLLQAAFRVVDTASPISLQVTPSATVPEPILLYGIDTPIPAQNVVANSPELLIASTDSESPASTVPSEPANDSLFVSTPADAENLGSPWHPTVDHAVTANEPNITLVSFMAVNSPWSAEARIEWLRPTPPDDSPEKRRDDDDNQWDELEEFKPRAGRSVFPRPDEDSTDQDEDEDKNSRSPDTESDTSGLFYDDTLFLEGAIVESFGSRFKLRLLLFDLDLRETDQDSQENVADNGRSRANDLIDIAAILRPESSRAPGEVPVDEASADEAIAQWKDASWENAQWKGVDPPRPQDTAKLDWTNLSFGRVENRDGNGSDIAKTQEPRQTAATEPTPIATVQ